jgi:hypothetical protein
VGDVPHLQQSSGTAWAGALGDLRTKIREALDALAKTAGDQRSAWQETVGDVKEFFATTTIGDIPDPVGRQPEGDRPRSSTPT